MTHLTLVPNFDHDAERAVLAACLMAPTDSLAACRDVGLSADDFEADGHRVLFRAMLALVRIGRTPDPITLGAFLEQHGVLDRAGGRDAIGALLQEIPTAANVRYHADLVRRAGRARRGRDDRREQDVQLAQVGDALAFLDLEADAFFRFPWEPLDRVVGGIHPGALAFVAGHPGGGKTSFLLTLELRLLAQGKRVYYAGLESRPNILRTQVACRVLGVDHGDVLAGNAQRRADWPEVRAKLKAEIERQRDLDGVYGRLRFAPQTHIGTGESAAIMAEAADWGADVVVVDHIDHVTADAKGGPYAESRQVVQVLDTLTKHHGLVTLASTQTNFEGRSADPYRNHRPIQEQHVYMGGHKNQVSHLTLGVYRPIEGGTVPKDLDKLIREGAKPITDALAPHTTAVNVMKSRVLGEGKHQIVTLGFWRGEVLDAVPTYRRLQSGAA
jgi:KaiC/GvpD/RAD55 family RecA-like ATPase